MHSIPSGAIFINISHTAFAPVDPESVKKTVKPVSLFMLFGSVHVKATRNYVDEIDPG
jgi:hypothetical protein